jgi:hypothetical protein
MYGVILSDWDTAPTGDDEGVTMYSIVPGPFYSPSALALAPRRSELADAVADMGTGMVLADDGRLVAFHESHLDTLTRLNMRSE